MSNLWVKILAVTGSLACPCHLPLTLPLLLGALGGTGIGSFVGANTGWIYGVATGYFIVGIGAGLYLLNRRQGNQGLACDVPERSAAKRRERTNELRS